MPKNNILDAILDHSEQSTKQTVKQKRIVEAAVKMFAEKGYSNTSTSEIAKVAEVSEGTIFKHYGTKDKLLLSLIVPYLKEFFPSMADEVLSEIMNDKVNTFEGFLRAFLKNRIHFISQNREIFQVLIKEMIYKEELKKELLPYISENITSRLTKIIEFYKERGELIEIPSEKILNMLLTFIGGFLVSRFILLNKQTVNDEEIEEATHFVMQGIQKSSSTYE